jgi:hypothetical protein
VSAVELGDASSCVVSENSGVTQTPKSATERPHGRGSLATDSRKITSANANRLSVGTPACCEHFGRVVTATWPAIIAAL